ncbi:MAG: DUF2330 domain-containing protein [Planctomycetota bacterium]
MARLVVLVLLASTAFADGKFFGRENAVVDVPDQSALLVWDKGHETLVIESAFVGEGNEFAWLVPLPSKPKIEASTEGLFPTLRALTAPDLRHDPLRGFEIVTAVLGFALFFLSLLAAARLKDPPSLAVVVLVLGVATSFSTCDAIYLAKGSAAGAAFAVAAEERTVGSYETAVLQAESASEVLGWLAHRGYKVPPAVGPSLQASLQAHLDEGWSIAAMRLRTNGRGRRVAHPLVFRFATPEPVYPMRLTGVGATRLSLDLFVAAPRQVAWDGMETRSAGEFGKDYRRLHPEIVRLVPRPLVLTHLHGELDAVAMRVDLRPTFVDYERNRPHFYTASSIRRAWPKLLHIVWVVLVFGVVVALARQAEDPGRAFRPRLVVALLVPLAVLLGGGVGLLLAPTGETVPQRPVRAFEDIYPLASQLADEGRLTLASLRAAVAAAGFREIDAPGGFVLRTRPDGVIVADQFLEDGSSWTIELDP